MELDKPSGLTKKIMAATIAAAVVLGAAGVANAVTTQDDTTPPGTASAQGTTTEDETLLEGDDEDTGESHENTEVPLVGTQADDVSAAALAAVPGGTVDRVETDDDGAAFEAHMTDVDGNRVTVKFDEALNVLGIEAGKGGDHGGRGDHTPLDEATTAQVTAAAEAAVPGGTVLKVEAEDAGYEAHVMGTDGIELEVYLDQDFAVIEVTPED